MWKCPGCREAVDDHFDICWKCGETKPEFTSAEYLGTGRSGPPEDPAKDASVPVQREEERSLSPLMSIPPLRGGDFQGIRVYRSDVFLGRARKANFRAQQHRLDEPTKLSLGMGASLQSPLPFRLARSL